MRRFLYCNPVALGVPLIAVRSLVAERGANPADVAHVRPVGGRDVVVHTTSIEARRALDEIIDEQNKAVA